MTPIDHEYWMRLALDLALQGEGLVEPNPLVGCVLVRENQLIGRGFHQQFGGPHAEIRALKNAGDAAGSTAYVTLEPCCHHGKTPPCTDALIAAGVAQVFVATDDPFPQVSGKGVSQLQAAGIKVYSGVLQQEAIELNRSWFKRIETGMPWVIAKWAMTLDGKIATASGSSQWISNEQSRAVVHQMRGRMDAIVVGIGTALTDNPLLTARPAGPRSATRIVMDSQARLPIDSRLVRDAGNCPVAVAVGSRADRNKCAKLAEAGCEIIELAGQEHPLRIRALLRVLGQREFTNVLVEGGGKLLGAFLDAGQIDEVHCFVAPKIAGGDHATTPIAGEGASLMSQAVNLDSLKVEILGSDIYVRGRVRAEKQQLVE